MQAWPGTIDNGVLRLPASQAGQAAVDYRLVNANELSGTYTRGSQTRGTFKRR